jgi:hypothetical protein
MPAARSRMPAETAADTAAPARPREQDIVVSRDLAATVYTIGQFPGEVQLVAASRDAALRVARAFARPHGVDVWYREGGTCHRLDAFRPAPRRR